LREGQSLVLLIEEKSDGNLWYWCVSTKGDLCIFVANCLLIQTAIALSGGLWQAQLAKCERMMLQWNM
jgi:hypothetical protein